MPYCRNYMKISTFSTCIGNYLGKYLIHFPPSSLDGFYGFDSTRQIKKKILWKYLCEFIKILTCLCCHQIGISTTWKRRGQSFRHDLLLDWFYTISQKGFKRNIFNNENSNIKTLHVIFDLYQWCLQFKAYL